MSYQAEGVIEWLREKPADLFPRNHHAADLIQSQQQRIEALSKVASEARGLLDSIQSGALSRNNCENLSMELIEDIDKALTDTTKAETNNEDQNGY